MKMSQIDANPLLKKTLDFSIAVVAYCELLEAARKFVVARQLLRSATSIGAMLWKPKMPKATPILFIR